MLPRMWKIEILIYCWWEVNSVAALENNLVIPQKIKMKKLSFCMTQKFHSQKEMKKSIKMYILFVQKSQLPKTRNNPHYPSIEKRIHKM